MKAVLILSFFLTKFTTTFNTIPSYSPAVDTCRIPTLITPNDDSQNDELIIPCLPANKNDNQSELFIFSEWGERVAYYKPYLNEWNGTYASKPLPDGTYFYVFKLTPNTVPQRGYVTIFR